MPLPAVTALCPFPLPLQLATAQRLDLADRFADSTARLYAYPDGPRLVAGLRSEHARLIPRLVALGLHAAVEVLHDLVDIIDSSMVNGVQDYATPILAGLAAEKWRHIERALRGTRDIAPAVEAYLERQSTLNRHTTRSSAVDEGVPSPRRSRIDSPEDDRPLVSPRREGQLHARDTQSVSHRSAALQPRSNSRREPRDGRGSDAGRDRAPPRLSPDELQLHRVVNAAFEGDADAADQCFICMYVGKQAVPGGVRHAMSACRSTSAAIAQMKRGPSGSAAATPRSGSRR